MIVWKDIPGFEGLYECSNEGLVRSVETKKLKGQSLNNSGYLRVELFKKNKRTRLFVHRVVAELFVPNSNTKNFNVVNHINGDKVCNKPENLEWTNKSGNQVHAVRLGLTKTLPKRPGELNNQSKLTTNDILLIREKRNKGVKLKDLAQEFGVTESNISIICLKKGWKDA